MDSFQNYMVGPSIDAHTSAASVDGEIFTTERQANISKEVAYQQHRFIALSKNYLNTQPWIPMLACIKHREVVNSFELSSARFSDIRDKEYWDQLEAEIAKLEAQCLPLIDDETLANLRVLCNFQALASEIAQAPTTIATLKSQRQELGRIEALFVGTPKASSGPPWLAAGIAIAAFAGAFAISQIEESFSDWRVLVLAVLGTAAAIVAAWLNQTHSAKLQPWDQEQRFRSKHERIQKEMHAAFYSDQFLAVLHLAQVNPSKCWNDFDTAAVAIDHVTNQFSDLNVKYLTALG